VPSAPAPRARDAGGDGRDRPLRLAIFDWDGTLADSAATIEAAMATAFLVRGHVPPAAEAVRACVGLRLDLIVARLLPDAPADEQAALVAAYRQAWADEMGREGFRERLFPGVRAGLAALASDGWLLAVATGKSRQGLGRCLALHGLEPLFVSLQTPDVAPSKPHPGMVLRALDECGAAPADTVVVGDTTYDMEMARAAGVTALGVRWGCHPPEALAAAGAAAQFDDFGSLVAYLRAR
jgi:phosphoglycolate phosphatase